VVGPHERLTIRLLAAAACGGLRPNRPRAARVSELSSIVTRTAVFLQAGLGRFGNRPGVN
jgi:hypothetical protein